jgi:hypothetical protein
MLLRSFFGLSFALLSVGGVSTAWAQDGGTWIDPPAQLPHRPSPPSVEGVAPMPPLTPSPREAKPEPPPAAQWRPDRADGTRAAQPRQEQRHDTRPTDETRRSVEPSRGAASKPPAAVGRAPERRGTGATVEAAQALAAEYLDTWSAPNGLALESTTAFYAPQVRFHGRVMSTRALLEEKRRFVRRWPERSYRPRLATMGTACAPHGRTCTVRSTFDFAAADPASGRRSEGIGILELMVSFAGERPVIAAENSAVLGRVRGERRSALEDLDE